MNVYERGMGVANNDGKLLGEYHDQRGQEFTTSFYDQLLNSVGPDLTIPTGSGQHGGIGNDHGLQQGSHEHPALFGQSQLRDGFGPIYAVPTFPGPHGDGQSQPIGSQGPINASPFFAGQPNMGSGHWHQCGIRFQAMMPWCMCYPVGYRHY